MTAAELELATQRGEMPPVASPTTMTELVSGILDDAQKLARQQFEMLRSELQEDIHRTKRVAELGAVAAVLFTIGGVTLVAFLVNLLHEQFQFSMWASCLIIGGIATAIGAACAIYAWNLFETFSPLPNKSLHALQETLTWKTQPQT
jgi:uncharacterized membrane protein YqjE